MSAFLDAFGWFGLGFVVGYSWLAVWVLGKRIVEEAKKAKEEW